MKRATIVDIATALGVTPSTVSRALSGNPRVSEATRDKVRLKALELGYQPNVVAAALRRGRSDTVGMVVPRINRHFFSHVIGAVEEILNPAGFNLLICQSHENADMERQAVEVLLKNRVAGIILSHAMETEDLGVFAAVARERVPIVQFDRVHPLIAGPRITNDNFSGAYLSVKHLIKSGYRRIVHLSGSLSVNIYFERHRGYCYAMEEAGLTAEARVKEHAITRETSYERTMQLLHDTRLDAVFCAGDYSAIGAIQAIKDKGLRVPDDVGVVGFANEPFSDFISPRLSTVEQNAYDLGQRTAKALIQTISREITGPPDLEELVPVRLLVRESSMPAERKYLL